MPVGFVPHRIKNPSGSGRNSGCRAAREVGAVRRRKLGRVSPRGFEEEANLHEECGEIQGWVLLDNKQRNNQF
jgi:hypothetical protein